MLLFTYTRYGYTATERNDDMEQYTVTGNELRCLPDPRGKAVSKVPGVTSCSVESAHELDGSRRDSFFLEIIAGGPGCRIRASVKVQKNQMETETQRALR